MQEMVDQVEIHRKAASGEVEERRGAVEQLKYDFVDLPDKEEAWKNLIRLTWGEDIGTRRRATYALGEGFQHIPDKERAWKNLNRLTRDGDGIVRLRATHALGTAFQHIPNKKHAWECLIQLTRDEYGDIRGVAAHALGTAFQHIPNKKHAWECLIQLTRDEEWYVRMSANHSLGKISICKATESQSEESFRKELEKALEFFKKSSKEATYSSNPSRFCLPFYRSFYTITFKKAGAEDEVQKYLAEAKSASEGSENKKALLEAVENLANALSEAQKVTDFSAMKSNLNTYRRYCDRAADLIGAAEGETPGAARVLRRGLPIIDDRIKELIPEIQEKAGAVCRETRGTGTPYEPLGMEVNKWAGELSDCDYLRDERSVSRIIDILGELCNLLPEDERDYPCNIVKEIREESELEAKLSDIATALSYLKPCIKSQLQNAAKPTTDEMRSDEHPSQKTGHSTTVIAEPGSTVVVTQTETESGDVTVTHNAKAIEESQPDKHRIDHRKKTAVEIIAAFAVSVLIAILSPLYLEDLTPTASTVIASIAFIILLTIILTQNRDESS